MLFTKNLELDGSIYYEPQDSLSISEYKWKSVDPETKKKISWRMNDVFDSVKWQNSYDYFNFIPYLTDDQRDSISPRLFNVFSGYRWNYTPITYKLDSAGLPVPPESIKPWIDHIKYTLCKEGQSGPELGHRIIQWYAHIFQNPTVKPWALVFQSEEGLGKGLWQTFFEQVLTKSLAAVFTSWDQITGTFNGKMSGKLLFTLNEATNYPTNTQKELMKSMIKDTELNINKKFVNQYDIDNYARIQITTNNDRPVNIPPDDRRYCCVKSDNTKRGNKEYFAPLVASRNDEKTQHDMFNYLTNYPLEGFNSEKPPMTKWKRELIGQNLNSAMEFIKEVCDDDVPTQSFGFGKWKEDVMKVSAKSLFDCYSEWCVQNGERKMGSNRSFFVELKNNGIEKKRLRIRDDNVQGLILDRVSIRITIDKLLCVESV
jgi:hypothetical protein